MSCRSDPDLPGPRAGVTGPWRGEPPRRPAGGERTDAGRAVLAPRLERVDRFHAWWYGARVLEPEVMAGEDEAAAYVDAAAQAHLARLDASWVEYVLASGPRGTARVLDVGTGGGQIPTALARRRPGWRVWAVDRSQAMLAGGAGERRAAVFAAARAGVPLHLTVARAEARALPFRDATFDLVLSNSLLHHLGDPSPVLDEVARVVRPDGRVVLRDLARPPGWRFALHVAWHGRHYRGTMRRLYEDSVAAAFTARELEIVLSHGALRGARVNRRGAYLRVER